MNNVKIDSIFFRLAMIFFQTKTANFILIFDSSIYSELNSANKWDIASLSDDKENCTLRKMEHLWNQFFRFPCLDIHQFAQLILYFFYVFYLFGIAFGYEMVKIVEAAFISWSLDSS